MEIPVNIGSVQGAKIAYPAKSTEELICTPNGITLRLKAGSYTARFLEIQLI